MIWLNIKDYEEEYQISERGEVRRLSKKGISMVKSCKASNGKIYVTLWKDGRRKSFMLHNLYADTFGVSLKCAMRILYEGYDGDLEAKENVRRWVIGRISECEQDTQHGKNLNEEIRYLKSFLRQLSD